VQAIHLQINGGEKKQAVYNLFAAYLHSVPLAQLIENVERARRDAQLRYVVIYGAACSYCLARAERLDGSYLRTFALELKEQLIQTLAAYVTSILAGRRRQDAGRAELPLRQIIEVLQQVMCTHVNGFVFPPRLVSAISTSRRRITQSQVTVPAPEQFPLCRLAGERTVGKALTCTQRAANNRPGQCAAEVAGSESGILSSKD
jgi:hypothetical protein